jgi:hypothetical protein
VWPISNKPISDSILIELNVQQPNSVWEEPEAQFTYVIYPDKILLLGLSQKNTVQQVRIHNIFGQLIASYGAGVDDYVPLGSFPSGIYLCEVRMADKSRKVIKFWH